MALVRTTDLIYENDIAPSGSDNFAAGFKVGDDWRHIITLDVYSCTGDGIWKNVTDLLKGKINGPIIIGEGSKLTPPALISNVDNYNPTGYIVSGDIVKSFLNIATSGGARIITGLVPSSILQSNIVYLHNNGPNNIFLRNNDSGSLATNRFDIGANRTIGVKETLAVIYDTTTLRWTLFAGQI